MSPLSDECIIAYSLEILLCDRYGLSSLLSWAHSSFLEAWKAFFRIDRAADMRDWEALLCKVGSPD